jgi:hypothetical protein
MRGFSTGGSFFIAALILPITFSYGVTGGKRPLLGWRQQKKAPLCSGALTMNREPLETLDYAIHPEVPIIL